MWLLLPWLGGGRLDRAGSRRHLEVTDLVSHTLSNVHGLESLLHAHLQERAGHMGHLLISVVLQSDDTLLAPGELIKIVLEDANHLLGRDRILLQLPVLSIPVVGPDHRFETQLTRNSTDAVVDITYIVSKHKRVRVLLPTPIMEIGRGWDPC